MITKPASFSPIHLQITFDLSQLPLSHLVPDFPRMYQAQCCTSRQPHIFCGIPSLHTQYHHLRCSSFHFTTAHSSKILLTISTWVKPCNRVQQSWVGLYILSLLSVIWRVSCCWHLYHHLLLAVFEWWLVTLGLSYKVNYTCPWSCMVIWLSIHGLVVTNRCLFCEYSDSIRYLLSLEAGIGRFLFMLFAAEFQGLFYF